MGKRTRLTALVLAASLILNMAVLPVRAEETTAPGSTQPTEEIEATVSSAVVTEEKVLADGPAPTASTAAPETTEAPQTTGKAPDETTDETAAETTDETAEETTAAATEETAAETETTEETTGEATGAAEEFLTLMDEARAVNWEPVLKDGRYIIDSTQKLIYVSNHSDTYCKKTLALSFSSDPFDTTTATAFITENGSKVTFQGLGTKDHPFEGELYILSGSNVPIRLNRPLFNYLSTDAAITFQDNDTSSQPQYLKLANWGTGSQSALLAENVVKRTKPANWPVEVLDDRDGAEATTNPPIIGTIEAGAQVTLWVNVQYTKPVTRNSDGNAGLLCANMASKSNDEISSLTLQELTGNLNFTVSSAGKVGALVGHMNKSASLTITPELDLSGTTVTSTGADAGGLVGVMENDAVLKYAPETLKVGKVTAKNNAGGIAGYAEDLDLTDTPAVTVAGISGNSNAGGLFGKYKYNAASDTAYGTINKLPTCTGTMQSANGAVGILIGELENSSASGTFTINLNNTTTGTETAAAGNQLSLSGKTVGGLIGKYTANKLEATLELKNVGTLNVNCSNKPDNFGGLIGQVNGSYGAYIDVTGADVSVSCGNQASQYFGGIVGGCSDNGHMICISNVKVGGKVEGSKGAGGLVGSMPHGVLKMGTGVTINTTLNNTKAKQGFVLGNRGNTLVYTTDSTWTRPTNCNEIGTWGQVIRADKLEDLITENAHTATVDAPAAGTENNPYVINNLKDFAAIALRYQLESKNALVIKGDFRNSTPRTITLNYNLDLNDTGFNSFQRDCKDGNRTDIEVKLNTNDSPRTITLPEVTFYTASGCHDYQGLFIQAKTLTISGLTLEGSITVEGVSSGTQYIGAVASQTGTATLENVTSEVTIWSKAAGDKNVISAMLGTIGSGSNNEKTNTTSLTNCTWNSTITDAAGSAQNQRGYFGGFVAFSPNNKSNKLKLEVTNCTVGSESGPQNAKFVEENTSKNNYFAFGAVLASTVDTYDKTLTINGLDVYGLKVDAKSLQEQGNDNNKTKSGGLLGYEWMKTTATLSGITIQDCDMNVGQTVFGGLVYKASGIMTLKKAAAGTNNAGTGVEFGKNTFTGRSSEDMPSALLVAYGCNDGDKRGALYLEIQDGAYTIKPNSVTVDIGTSVNFDEIMGNNRNAQYGNGIVSIATPDNAPIDQTTCNTYHNKAINKATETTGQWENSLTRYYYNLDAYRKDKITDGKVNSRAKMMLWDAYQDSHSSVRGYFAASDSFTISGPIDLSGYSYYPMPFTGDTEISNAAITFDYSNMNTQEAGNIQLDDDTCQHYRMQTGIFSELTVEANATASKTLTVNDLTLAGDVGPYEGNRYGALICGNVQGDSTNARAVLNLSNITLAGIRVSDANLVKESGDVAPLLIYSIGDYTNLKLNGVTVANNPDSTQTYTGYAASSLIGAVGSANGKQIQLTFSDMQLDGRTRDSLPNDDYATKDLPNTSGSIFSRALFLESFQYTESSRGVYNFTDENCTLGKELSNITSGRNPGKQHWYYNDLTHAQNDIVANRLLGIPDEDHFATGYMRYVKEVQGTPGNCNELDVNLTIPGLTEGCGTYSHPYIINKAEQLLGLRNALHGAYLAWPVNLDFHVLENVKKNSFADAEDERHTAAGANCAEFTYDGDKWTTGDTNLAEATDEEVLRYLRNAYYQLGEDISFDPGDNWQGLGEGSKDKAFCGVIDGSGKTVTIPGGSYSQMGGLVLYSMGSVVRNVIIQYTDTATVVASASGDTTASFFGGAVGWCLGGDTIVEGVSVTFDNQPTVFSCLSAVGGYVGMVGGALMSSDGKQELNFGGGVVFRGTIAPGLTAENSGFYYNPYVGRVLDGYAVNEGSTGLDNTDKNYQIRGISEGTHLTYNAAESTVTVNDGEGLWLLSAIANSGAAMMNDAVAYTYGRVRTGTYANIGTADKDTGATADDGYLGGVWQSKTGSYLNKYATGDFSNLTKEAITISFAGSCDMSGYGNGFRGIGTSYGTNVNTKSNSRLLQISAVNGNSKTVTLAQQRNEYRDERNGWTTIGSGLFVLLRPASTGVEISNLTLSGKTGITYYTSDGKACGNTTGNKVLTDNMWDDKNRANWVSNGMLASSLAGGDATSVTLKGVKLVNAEENPGKVNSDGFGCMAAGGLIGAVGNKNSSVGTLTMTDCTYAYIKVRGLSMVGGLIGYQRVGTTNIHYTKDSQLTDATLEATMQYALNPGDNGDNKQEVGGLIGMAEEQSTNAGSLYINTDENDRTLTIRNLTASCSVTGDVKCDVGGLVGFQSFGKSNDTTIQKICLAGEITFSGEGTGLNAGGLFGHASDYQANNWSQSSNNPYNLTIQNIRIGCQEGDQFTISNGCQTGGLFGLVKNPAGTVEVSNIQIGSDKSKTRISGPNSCAGGLSGMIYLATSLTAENVQLNKVVIDGASAGGVFGAHDNSKNVTVKLKNLAVENCTIQCLEAKDKYSGGIYGQITRTNNTSFNIQGFNILLWENKIAGTNSGLIGGNQTGDTEVKLTGVSMVQETEHSVPTAYFAGTSKKNTTYVVRADYTGNQNTEIGKYPHVTVSPKSSLEVTDADSQPENAKLTITGDGASFGKNQKPIGEIIRQDAGKTTVDGDEQYLRHTDVKDARNFLTEGDAHSKLAYFGSFLNDGDNGSYTGADFPALVIATTSPTEANQALYSALSLLTNRQLYSLNGNAIVPSAPEDMSISAANYGWNGTAFAVNTKDFGMKLDETTKTVSLTGEYDNTQSRFTLLDVRFTDPTGGKEPYHLYVPVIIKKVFEFKFWAAALAGTNYYKTTYDSLSDLALAFNGENVTALMGYEYVRTKMEWQKAVNTGENLLWNFTKEVILSGENNGPEDTMLTLVDCTGQDKAYTAYYQDAVQASTSGPVLNFSKFKDAAGNSWKPARFMCDYLSLTAKEQTDGEYIRCAEGVATIRDKDGNYYRPWKNGDKDKRYHLTVGLGESQTITEQYYLTIKTPKNDTNLWNFSILSPNRLSGGPLPTNRLPASDTNENSEFARNGAENHVTIGSFISQSASLRTSHSVPEGTTDNEKLVPGNAVITTDMQATITPAQGVQGLENYSGDQNIYQCFELSFRKHQAGTGTQSNIPAGTRIQVTFHREDGEPMNTLTYDVGSSTGSILLQYPQPIALRDLTKKDSRVSISASATLMFTDAALLEGFITRQADRDGIGLEVTSRLAFQPENLPGSAMATGKIADSNSRRYYRGEQKGSASLVYNPRGKTDQAAIGQLGINALKTGSSVVSSVATYDVHAISSEAEGATKLVCQLSLAPREGYGLLGATYAAAVNDWKAYVKQDKLTAQYVNKEGKTVTAETQSYTYANGRCTVEFTVSHLNPEDPIQILVDNTVKTGAEFEQAGHTYANYRITMDVWLEKENAKVGSVNDYIVYTNAKIYDRIIRQTPATP